MNVRRAHRGGELTSQAVVDAARTDPTRYPETHSRLEWDNAIAGEAHRRAQAQGLIRSIRVTFTRATGEETSVRRFHAVPRPEQDRYVYDPLEEIVDDPLKRRVSVGIVTGSTQGRYAI